VAIMGGSSRRGRLRLSRRLTAIAIMGGDEIDLRDAEIDGEELTINVFVLMGGCDIYVPDTVDVDVGGFSLMGGTDERGSRRPPRPAAPFIKVRAYALMGGTDVWRLPAETGRASLKEARRAAKELEGGA
jgi:Cell wall-active antibiotics response 4TMS YvqF